ncbi:MAG: hypothetical protein E7006_03300 [Alphaproteobacteria bacterium]|nr:hypothetical protein [Alphaproteobacteria bacterium]
MGHYEDFLESLLDDNVMRDFNKLVREMKHSESQSKITHRDWKHRQEHCKRAQQIRQRNIMRSFHNMRSQVKS